MTTLAAHITTAETAAEEAWIEARKLRDSGLTDSRLREIASLLAAGYDQIKRAKGLAGENGDAK